MQIDLRNEFKYDMAHRLALNYKAERDFQRLVDKDDSLIELPESPPPMPLIVPKLNWEQKLRIVGNICNLVRYFP